MLFCTALRMSDIILSRYHLEVMRHVRLHFSQVPILHLGLYGEVFICNDTKYSSDIYLIYFM